jgi:hypothetical protein
VSTGRRQSLADLVGPKPAVSEVAELPAAVVDVRSAPAVAEPDVQAVTAAEPVPAAREPRRRTKAAGTPKYLQLERKEVRITAGQYDRLTALARRLNRQRSRGSEGKEGERITENTLIRIAIDMLLGQEGALGGASEEALRKSVLP